MTYEPTLGAPFLAGILALVSLFLAWYTRVDPLVSRVSPYSVGQY
jgi:hypothetical protein